MLEGKRQITGTNHISKVYHMAIESLIDRNRSLKNVTYHRKINVTSPNNPD